MDDLKSIHVDQGSIDYFIQFIYCKYGDPDIEEVKATREKIHNSLRMNFDYYEKFKVIFDMRDYVKKMIDNFPINLD